MIKVGRTQYLTSAEACETLGIDNAGLRSRLVKYHIERFRMPECPTGLFISEHDVSRLRRTVSKKTPTPPTPSPVAPSNNVVAFPTPESCILSDKAQLHKLIDEIEWDAQTLRAALILVDQVHYAGYLKAERSKLRESRVS